MNQRYQLTQERIDLLAYDHELRQWVRVPRPDRYRPRPPWRGRPQGQAPLWKIAAGAALVGFVLGVLVGVSHLCE